MSPEQIAALEVLTGSERLAVLVGPAGTGKGVVIDALARAEQHAGNHTIGIAVSGSTAERLGADSPALTGHTLTLDALVARANPGTVEIDRDTTIVLDEAGMVDHARLDALTELVERSSAKLIAVGDGKQLPSIGPGGMFDRLTGHAPTAELADLHRTSDAGEQKAWRALRAGEPERAMAHYHSLGRLHLADTRDQAAENAVQAWGQLTSEHDDIRSVALIADASNQEIDRLNARAQHLRAERGELGHQEFTLPSVHYGLRDGDLIAFTAQHRPRGQPRVENGTRGQVTHVHEHGVTITLDGSGRRVQLASEHLDSLRLAYAQHVYHQQGATVERSIVVTGGWQTSKETAYVEATRARHGTDWYIARDQLGDDGQDAVRIKTTRPEHEPQSQTDTITRLPGGRRCRLATQPKPPTTATYTATCPLAHTPVRPRRARPQRWTWTLTLARPPSCPRGRELLRAWNAEAQELHDQRVSVRTTLELPPRCSSCARVSRASKTPSISGSRAVSSARL